MRRIRLLICERSFLDQAPDAARGLGGEAGEGARGELDYFFVSVLSLTRLRMQHEDEVVRLEREHEEN